MSASTSTCGGCGITLPERAGPTHRYMVTSPECWGLFGGVLIREYLDMALMFGVHRLTVDSYAAQHPGGQSAKSLAVHLAGLHLAVDRGESGESVRRLVGDMLDSVSAFPDFELPGDGGGVTVGDVHATESAEAHVEAVLRWAESVWGTWGLAREEIIALLP